MVDAVLSSKIVAIITIIWSLILRILLWLITPALGCSRLTTPTLDPVIVLWNLGLLLLGVWVAPADVPI